jgi:hypothetical protein
VSTTQPVCIKFDLSDKLLDLKLAVWETQLEELYPSATISCTFDPIYNLATVKVFFADQEEALHWQLSNQTITVDPLGWLTYSAKLLSCAHEQTK